MKHSIFQKMQRSSRISNKLKQSGWVEVCLGIPDPIDEDADAEPWFDRICDAVEVVVPWLRRMNIDFRIFNGNFLVRRRKATLVKIRWCGNF